ncbi:YxlC family protein [Bacillus alkalicellulosilyticus]|uniref:YxlC family protein n=1 Tax=Alkalihalobacterium alkalicellulosilyticum TaxID=1912214 RepID=UPI000996E67A|nr:YxlC family protein [Bacillus alkalicellulosilyticus]
MKKQNDQQDKITNALQQDWKNLDSLAEQTPSVFEIKEQIVAFKAERKKAFYKEFGLFLLTAILILTAIAMSIAQAPILFLVIQGLAVIVLPIIGVVLYKKEKAEGDTAYDNM